jgi:hypothetical protein
MTTFIWRFRSCAGKGTITANRPAFGVVVPGGPGTWLIAAALSNPLVVLLRIDIVGLLRLLVEWITLPVICGGEYF